MALITETGTGASDAESYISVADADAYHANRANSAWSSATTASKEAALRKAASYIDGNYRFCGCPSNATQALQWPRIGVRLNDYPLATNVIPRQLQYACAELALVALSESLTSAVDSQSVASKTVGPISISYAAPRNGGRKRYPAADDWLSGLMQSRFAAEVSRA